MKHLYKASAFTKDGEGGNKAGVYIQADGLSDTDMQTIAKDVGYSETAFVMKSDNADFKVRFFTPTSEVNLCGHATIATYHVLKSLEIISEGIYTQETKAGILKIKVTKDAVFMQQNKPVFYQSVNRSDLKDCFDTLVFDEHLEPYIVSTGMKEIFLPVKNKELLHHIKPNINKIIRLSRKHGVIGIHAFVLDDEVDVYGRNFAPLIGIDEESATGTSNGALACYLHKFHHKKNTYTLRQGYSMNSPSEIDVNLKTHDTSVDEVWVGGKATITEYNKCDSR